MVVELPIINLVMVSMYVPSEQLRRLPISNSYLIGWTLKDCVEIETNVKQKVIIIID